MGWFHCPVCGEEVNDRERRCPHCGADDDTGWKGLGGMEVLPEPFTEEDYKETLEREFGLKNKGPGKKGFPRIFTVAAIILLLLFLIGLIYRQLIL